MNAYQFIQKHGIEKARKLLMVRLSGHHILMDIYILRSSSMSSVFYFPTSSA
jgi:hypothetical protein